MALVDYSDSEESENEQPQPSQPKTAPKVTVPPITTKFAVDKSNPRKIRINLQETELLQPTQCGTDGEPAAKRPRIGAGAFSGFNALLPPPKRDAEQKMSTATAGKQPRKVFSLKTGAEPGFSRESDAELRELFAEQDVTRHESESLSSAFTNRPATSEMMVTQKPQSSVPKTGNAMMFKPLS